MLHVRFCGRDNSTPAGGPSDGRRPRTPQQPSIQAQRLQQRRRRMCQNRPLREREAGRGVLVLLGRRPSGARIRCPAAKIEMPSLARATSPDCETDETYVVSFLFHQCLMGVERA